jgi:hypothetical protein
MDTNHGTVFESKSGTRCGVFIRRNAYNVTANLGGQHEIFNQT